MDKTFFERIVTPKLEEKYKVVKIITYTGLKKSVLEATVNNITKRGAPYIFSADMDNPVCYTKKKDAILRRVKVDPKKIIIVKSEIESWYVAGLKQSDAKTLRVVYHTNTESVTKEILDRMRPPFFLTRHAYMQEILRRYSLKTAKENNPSFAYFCNKFL